MKPYILMIIDHQLNPDKYTQEQLEQNANDADADYAAHIDDAVADSYRAAAIAADAATYYADADYAAAYWLNEYFKLTGENRQDYIDAINKDNK
ncbi:MAG: hypothetical protein GY941_26290 [Planctomycetes bacterium]|nr:hypothetical protein [Planctomycetota bacterium]